MMPIYSFRGSSFTSKHEVREHFSNVMDTGSIRLQTTKPPGGDSFEVYSLVLHKEECFKLNISLCSCFIWVGYTVVLLKK